MKGRYNRVSGNAEERSKKRSGRALPSCHPSVASCTALPPPPPPIRMSEAYKLRELRVLLHKDFMPGLLDKPRDVTVEVTVGERIIQVCDTDPHPPGIPRGLLPDLLHCACLLAMLSLPVFARAMGGGGGLSAVRGHGASGITTYCQSRTTLQLILFRFPSDMISPHALQSSGRVCPNGKNRSHTLCGWLSSAVRNLLAQQYVINSKVGAAASLLYCCCTTDAPPLRFSIPLASVVSQASQPL
jgi:hypothetical protein